MQPFLVLENSGDEQKQKHPSYLRYSGLKKAV